MLLLDIGNSRIKAARAGSGGIEAVSAIAHAGDPAVALQQLPPEKPQHIAVANVTGAAHEQQIGAALQARYGIAPAFARTQASCGGLRLAYAQPERLGVDRWLMMLALWREAAGPFGVAGAGTALTYDAVDATGQHLGGFIAAGLGTHLQAVLGATRFGTGDLGQQYSDGLGQDTEACVRQGAFLACLGALEHAARRHPAARQVISGGDGPLLQPWLPAWSARPQLVLEGLLAWTRMNSPGG
ncbi:type III pantothenate kinase [Solimonas sp. K1W22B-7]|nr:type III pantothenate kinase [Solimonas sp. K1W22B-7]